MYGHGKSPGFHFVRPEQGSWLTISVPACVGPSPEDLFESMFGAGFGGAGMYTSSRSSRPRGPPRKKDSIVKYEVTLEQLYTGKRVCRTYLDW